jgi:drug/metabolite transporter (DMT)-like permease
MERMTKYADKGVPLALASAFAFGASTPLAKALLGNGINPWMLAGLLYLSSGFGLAAYQIAMYATGRASGEAPLRWPDLPWLALVILTGGAVGPLLLMLGLLTTTASSAALLLNLEGLATMAIAWLVFRENADARILTGAAAILGGAVVLSWRSGAGGLSWGAALIAGACLAWGIDNNVTRKLSGADPVQIATAKGLVAGAVNCSLALATGARFPAPHLVGGAAIVGIFGYGVSLVFFVLALRYLGSARTGAYFSTAPFIGAVLAVGWLGEPFTATLALAALLMGFGVYLHLTERHVHEHAHDVLEHEHRHIHDAHHQHAHGPDDPSGEPHTHRHRHEPLTHSHPHYPDLHHRHGHG